MSLRYSKYKLMAFLAVALMIICYLINIFFVGFRFIPNGRNHAFIERILEMFDSAENPFITTDAIILVLGLVTILVAYGFSTVAVVAKTSRRRYIWDTISAVFILTTFILAVYGSVDFMNKTLEDAQIVNNQSDLKMYELFHRDYIALWFCLLVIPTVIALTAIILSEPIIFNRLFPNKALDFEISGGDRIYQKGAVFGIAVSILGILGFLVFIVFYRLISTIFAFATWDWSDVGKTAYLYTTAGRAVYVILFLCIAAELGAIAICSLIIWKKDWNHKIMLTFGIILTFASIIGGLFILIETINRLKLNNGNHVRR